MAEHKPIDEFIIGFRAIHSQGTLELIRSGSSGVRPIYHARWTPQPTRATPLIERVYTEEEFQAFGGFDQLGREFARHVKAEQAKAGE